VPIGWILFEHATITGSGAIIDSKSVLNLMSSHSFLSYSES